MKKGQDNCFLDANGFPMGNPYRSGGLFLINGQKLTIKYQLIEITFKTPGVVPNSIQIGLNNFIQGYLLDSFYWSIEVYTAATIASTPTTGVTVIPQGTVNSGYMTLIDNNSFQFWVNKPLRDLQTINDTAQKVGKNYVDGMGGILVNWQNGTINLYDTSGLAASTTYSIPLGLAFSLYPNYQYDGIGTNRTIDKIYP